MQFFILLIIQKLKEMNETMNKKRAYEAPKVEVIEVPVEQGYCMSCVTLTVGIEGVGVGGTIADPAGDDGMIERIQDGATIYM